MRQRALVDAAHRGRDHARQRVDGRRARAPARAGSGSTSGSPAASACGGGPEEEAAVAPGRARAADRTAVDPGGLHADEEHPVEARVAGDDGAVAGIGIERRHVPTMPRSAGARRPFSDLASNFVRTGWGLTLPDAYTGGRWMRVGELNRMGAHSGGLRLRSRSRRGCKEKDSLIVVSVSADSMASDVTNADAIRRGGRHGSSTCRRSVGAGKVFGLYVPSDVMGDVTSRRPRRGGPASATKGRGRRTYRRQARRLIDRARSDDAHADLAARTMGSAGGWRNRRRRGRRERSAPAGRGRRAAGSGGVVRDRGRRHGRRLGARRDRRDRRRNRDRWSRGDRRRERDRWSRAGTGGTSGTAAAAGPAERPAPVERPGRAERRERPAWPGILGTGDARNRRRRASAARLPWARRPS